MEIYLGNERKMQGRPQEGLSYEGKIEDREPRSGNA